MNEDEYKDVYPRVVGTKCVFEKSILLQFAQCNHAEKRLLAEREAISCDSQACQFKCQKFLDILRQNARFSLQQTQADTPLPHSKEIKVQAGGVYGLQQLLEDADPSNVTSLGDHIQRFNQDHKPIVNIKNTLDRAIDSFGSVEKLPYSDMVRAIMRFQVRKKRERRKD